MTDAAPAPQPDPFALAKANLRETIKWLTTIFGALAAAVIAGTSVGGISGLSGLKLAIALLGGGVGVLSTLLATGVMLRLLTSHTFYLGRLANDPELLTDLDRHAADILPPQFETVQAFLDDRNRSIKDIRNTELTNEKRKEAEAFYTSAEPVVWRLVNLGQLEVMKREFRDAQPCLLALSLCALVGLGVYAVTSGSSKSASPPASPSLSIDWTGTGSLSASMPARPGRAKSR